MYALRVPRLVLPTRTHQDSDTNQPDGGSTRPLLPSADPHHTRPQSPPPAPTGTDDLLDTWYPELKHMVCAGDDDASSGSACAGEEMSWLQYARLFAASSPELRGVVEEHDARARKEREERVAGWLRAVADVYVR